VVAGTLRVTRPSRTLGKVKRGDSRLVHIGIPATIAVAGDLDVAVVREGDRVSVTGEPVTEIVPELAFHRDAGEATVMRGRAGAVVIVQGGGAAI
jgi:hypothetical protein